MIPESPQMDMDQEDRIDSRERKLVPPKDGSSEELSPDEHEMLLNALCTGMSIGEHGQMGKPYPTKTYWKKNRRKAWDLYQKIGQSIGEEEVRISWKHGGRT